MCWYKVGYYCHFGKIASYECIRRTASVDRIWFWWSAKCHMWFANCVLLTLLSAWWIINHNKKRTRGLHLHSCHSLGALKGTERDLSVTVREYAKVQRNRGHYPGCPGPLVRLIAAKPNERYKKRNNSAQWIRLSRTNVIVFFFCILFKVETQNTLGIWQKIDRWMPFAGPGCHIGKGTARNSWCF